MEIYQGVYIYIGIMKMQGRLMNIYSEKYTSRRIERWGRERDVEKKIGVNRDI